MTQTESWTAFTVIVDENGKMTIYEPKIDPNEGITPELRAKLLAMNDRLRPKKTSQQPDDVEDGPKNGPNSKAN